MKDPWANCEFEHDFTSKNLPLWDRLFSRRFSRPQRILEIGTLEGRSLLWLLSKFTHPETRIDVVDPLREAYARRFRHNLAQHPWEDRVTVHKGTSQRILPRLLAEECRYDFVYVDGSHQAPDVLFDMTCSWQMLKWDGLLVCDDYLWRFPEPKFTHPASVAIDAFALVHGFRCQVLAKETCAVLRKRPSPDDHA